MPITLLPPDLVGKIAAGEVVERPASAVKELIENALDAGARRISIEVRVGGRELLKVTDDGGGIPRDELLLALQQHATSKLRTADDLTHIATLGFRGEALGSLAAVARVTIVSRTPEAQSGYEITGCGAERSTPRPVACPPGTSITVRELFANVPARLKFLRAAATEHGVIGRIVTAYALARPEVRFELLIDGRRTISTDGGGDRHNAIVGIHGAEVAAQMLPLDAEAAEVPDVRVDGYVSAPSLNRAHRQGIMLFVNGRWIQNRALGFALEEAYHSLLMIGRHPLAIVDIALPPELVDVNVHPTKSEVRFLDERAVCRALSRATRAAVLHFGRSAIPDFTLSPVSYTEPMQQTQLDTGIQLRWPNSTVGTLESLPQHPQRGEEAPMRASIAAVPERDGLPATTLAHTPLPVPPAPHGGPRPTPETPPGRLPPLRVLGQAGASYIIAEGPEGVFLIDQHAAHERILLDQLLAGAERAAPDSQLLLEPLVLDLTPPQIEALETANADLAALGFAIEPFGARAWAVRAVPAALAAGRARNLGETLIAILEEAAQGGQSASWLERLAGTTACHSAIRANQSLTLEEMRALIGQLERTTLPRTCAHGRPTMLQVNLGDLERQFGRHG